ncbi:hypothetical protein [Telmatospirillum siberiense]|uniref:Outer envelope protein n=1 Tax=Telmatospirillum siberiense TaxID=382514 RepID=A0A2N3Q1V3_9PROT|nr:hypothetical protein [Telmatospirillum siberiense]PKU26640.1 hypothetical protein CWS72_02080 [Telmatospirillum siberiense]
MLKKLLPSLLAICAGMAAAPAHASDFLWTDTYLSYRYLWQDKQPGTYKDVQEHAVNLSHADEWDYGANFFSLDVEQFTRQDATNYAFASDYQNGGTKSTGSGEFYGLFRSSFSGNKISGTKVFAFGPIKDVSLEIGADWCTQNDAFASNKKMIVAGPQFSIALPKGFWDISIHMAHEWNTNGYHDNGQADNFDAVPEFETSWLYPITIGPVPMKFTGYANLIGPKGKGTSNDAGHTTEFLAHPKLMFDVGAMAGGKPGKVDAGIGYEYWLNKFGTRSSASVPNPVQRAVFFEVGYHFN